MRTTTGIIDLIEISENNKPCSTPQMTAGGTLGRPELELEGREHLWPEKEVSCAASDMCECQKHYTGTQFYDVGDKFAQPWCFIFSRDYFYSDMRAMNLLEPKL